MIHCLPPAKWLGGTNDTLSPPSFSPVVPMAQTQNRVVYGTELSHPHNGLVYGREFLIP